MSVQTIPMNAAPVLGAAKPMAAAGLGPRRLGQWGDVVSAAITAGVQIYSIEQQKEMAKDREEFAQAQADKAAAREAEALRIQQEMLKATQEKAATAAAPGGSGAPIMGMQPGVFYTVAGVGAGALLLGIMFMMRGK